MYTKVTLEILLWNKVSILQDVITLQHATQEYTPMIYMGLWTESCKIHVKI